MCIKKGMLLVKFKRMTAFVSALTLSLALAAPAGAANHTLVPKTADYTDQFTDIRNAWCESAVKTCYETGLLLGKTADRFDAVSPLTNAQITVITARLCAQLRGEEVPKSSNGPWYQGSVDYLKSLGIQGTTAYQADMACARTAFVTLLGQGLEKCDRKLPQLNAIQAVPDSYPLPVGSVDYPLEFYRAGILQGSDRYGSFKSGTTLTRGAAAAMLARIADPAQRLQFTDPAFDVCRDIYHMAPDTVLVTIEEQPLTVGQVGRTLAAAFRTEGNLDKALEQLKLKVAASLLFEELGLEPSAEQQAQYDTSAKQQFGKLGLNEQGRLWEQQATMAHNLLCIHFGDQTVCQDAIAKKAAVLSLEAAPALSELDQNALLKLCRTTPITWA